MSFKELMVGDWVRYGNRFAIVKSISYDKCVILVSVNGQDELVSETYDNIEPVPVTSDILKKNGIEFDERLCCYASGDKRITLDDRDEFMNTENKWYIHADTIDLCSIGSCEITYVHEMQHFLRLCNYQLDITVQRKRHMEIEFKQCETSSYSPWHLEIAKNLEVPLCCNDEIGYFVKVGDDIYNIFYMGDYYDLYKYFCDLEKKNDSGELSDDNVLALLSSALDNPHKIRKCNSLDEFRKQMINIITRTKL